MVNKQRFSYRNLDQLKDAISRRGLDLPTSEDFSVLAEPVGFGRLTVPNRMIVQPMEGCDADSRGRPSELTVRRYRRFAAGGSGMIWWEACAVSGKARANPRQLWIHEENVEDFARMVSSAREAAAEIMGHRPVFVLQLTHSGRYSKPAGAAAPIIAHHSPVLDPTHNLPADYPLITDDELDELQESFVAAARLAAQAGFDAVGIKSCHRYLLSELLASFTRENSRYGGSFENRTRMLRETAGKVIDAVGDRIELTCRMNAYDAIAHPYGWGVDESDASKPDLAEPIRLIGELGELGMAGVNITIGNPYFNPYVNRPADWMIADWPDPPEHPIDGVARMVAIAREIQQACVDTPIVGSGYSWLRQYFPYFASATVAGGGASLVGLGRGALAYPNFARDIINTGRMDPHSVCVACSSCTQIMRDGGKSGCAARDHEVYGPILREGRAADREQVRKMASRCRECVDAMCVTRCPAGVDIPGFVGAVAHGDEPAAYRILRQGNILPEICSLVCPVEVQCQSACIQYHIGDGAVSIAEIQRRLSERAVAAGWAALDIPHHCTGRNVAVVGAGPGGLSAAAELLQKGHRVTMIERSGRSGGKLGSVIPSARLSDVRAQSESRAIFSAVPSDRITWRFNTALGLDFTLDDLAGEGFDAIVLAVGLGAGPTLSGQARPQGVLDAEAFLRQMNSNIDHQCPPRVAVIGGGNSAADAAVCAKRRGGRDVYMIYRRSYEQMPAWPSERDSVLHSGVHLMLLNQPKQYVCDPSGRLTGIRIVRTELADADGGRRRPVEQADSEFVLAVDMAIEAIGQNLQADLAAVLGGVELTDDGLVRTLDESQATTRQGVWAAGDVTNGGTTVVQAIAEGHRAAEAIDVHLAGAPSHRSG